MEELVGLDVERNCSDGANARKNSDDREQDGDGTAKGLDSTPQPQVFGQLPGLQKCQCRQHKVQWGEPNRSTN